MRKENIYVCKNIKRLRLELKLSQAGLARADGISKKSLARLENGKAKRFSFKVLNRLCYVLQVGSVNDLLD